MHRRFHALFLAVLAAGCGSSAPYFSRTGFHGEENAYFIPYVAGTQELVGESWQTDNFQHDQGRPVEMLDEGEFLGTLEWTQEDGEVEEVTTVIYDLDLSHTSNARIWVRVLPIPSALVNKEIGILAENFVNNLTGSASRDYFGKLNRQRRVATEILKSRGIWLAEHDAHAVTFDVVNLDQLELNPDAPRTRVELLLVQTSFWKHLDDGGKGLYARGYLLLGYSNDADRFEEHMKTFEEFAKRIRLIDME